jgi:hypothetical protein
MGLLNLFKPAWQSKNEKKRLKAVEKITDKAFLKEVADEAVLKKVATKAKDSNVVSNYASYPPYSGSGVCDVCHRSLSGVKAYLVPNSVFYSSPKWRALFKSINFMATDADIERRRNLDTSQGSAVCENCIHMF